MFIKKDRPRKEQQLKLRKKIEMTKNGVEVYSRSHQRSGRRSTVAGVSWSGSRAEGSRYEADASVTTDRGLSLETAERISDLILLMMRQNLPESILS